MAEWTGRKRTLNSIVPVGNPPVDAASDPVPPSPTAPGAEHSPQRPGETPDKPALVGKPRGSFQPLSAVRRPLTEYGTAQRVLGMYTPPPGVEMKPENWEQGPAAQEETRRAHPALGTPRRPLSGYGLGLGRSAAVAELADEALEAIGDAQAATTPVADAAAAPAASAPAAPAAPAAMGLTAQGAVPAGAVKGDGTHTCPPEYPIKGNAQSMLYHDSTSRSYSRTIAEFCFTTADAAQAAGFRAARDH